MEFSRYQIIILIILVVLYGVAPAWGKKPYKIYVINRFGAWDIVCDSYTVKKDDHVWEILRRKGRIAEDDFPRFVSILKNLNPHIKDVNKIYPRQEILVPLKQMEAKESPQGPGARYVTIPIIPDVLYKTRKVHPGECLSRIVTASLEIRWDEIPGEYFQTLKRLNPRIKDLDLIYPGQMLRIPELAPAEWPTAQPTPPVVATPTVVAEDMPVQMTTEEEAQEQVASQEASASLPTEILPSDATIAELVIQEPSSTVSRAVPPKQDRLDTRTVTPKEIQTRAEATIRSAPSPVRTPPPEKDIAELDAEELIVTEPKPVAGDKTIPAGSAAGQKHLAKADSGKPAVGLRAETRSTQSNVPEWHEEVSRIVARIGWRLLASGHCHFPGKSRDNMTLDLAAFPVVELNDGRHLLLETKERLPSDMEETIRAYWKDLSIISTNTQETGAVVLEKVFCAMFGARGQKVLDLPILDDDIQVGLRGDWVFHEQSNKGGRSAYYCITFIEDPQEYTADSVVEYLAKQNIRIVDVLTKPSAKEAIGGLREQGSKEPSVLGVDGSSHEAFLYRLVKEMGYSYEPGVPLSFDYAGFQIETTVNLIYGKNGLDVVVDFGTFYGDAKSAIETGGLKVLSIKADDQLLAVARNVLQALGARYTEDPVLFVANRRVLKTTSLTLPGLLLSQANEKRTLLTQAKLQPRLLDFLAEQQITVMKIKERC